MGRVGTQYVSHFLLVVDNAALNKGSGTRRCFVAFGVADEVRCNGMVVVQFINPAESTNTQGFGNAVEVGTPSPPC